MRPHYRPGYVHSRPCTVEGDPNHATDVNLCYFQHLENEYTSGCRLPWNKKKKEDSRFEEICSSGNDNGELVRTLEKAIAVRVKNCESLLLAKEKTQRREFFFAF